MKKRKGIIIDDPREYYMDISNFVNTTVPKKYVDKDKKKEAMVYKKENITYGMVVSVKETDNNLSLCLVTDRVNNNLKVMGVKRFQADNLPYTKLRSVAGKETDYLDFENVKEVDVNNVTDIEYFVPDKTLSTVLQKYKNHMNNKMKVKAVVANPSPSFKFGDILSLKDTKEKLIFICKRKKQIYTCSFSGMEIFSGMRKINKDLVLGKYDELLETDKKVLLDRLDRALNLDKYIPGNVKDKVSVLVKKK